MGRRDGSLDTDHDIKAYSSSDNEPNFSIKIEHKSSSVDTTTGPQTELYPGVVSSDETQGAQRGQAYATRGLQDPGPFTYSAGMHSIGSDHIDAFSSTVQYSGGVIQGKQFTSDPAPGVARCKVDGNHTYSKVKVQSEGSGETFQERQRSRWAGHGG